MVWSRSPSTTSKVRWVAASPGQTVASAHSKMVRRLPTAPTVATQTPVRAMRSSQKGKMALGTDGAGSVVLTHPGTVLANWRTPLVVGCTVR